MRPRFLACLSATSLGARYVGRRLVLIAVVQLALLGITAADVPREDRYRDRLIHSANLGNGRLVSYVSRAHFNVTEIGSCRVLSCALQCYVSARAREIVRKLTSPSETKTIAHMTVYGNIYPYNCNTMYDRDFSNILNDVFSRAMHLRASRQEEGL
jgi:hypothetical protein